MNSKYLIFVFFMMISFGWACSSHIPKGFEEKGPHGADGGGFVDASYGDGQTTSEKVTFDTTLNDNSPQEAGECTDGEKRPCYEGPKTRPVIKPCQKGTQICKGGKWGPCKGQVLPKVESCNGMDDNCDGKVDAPMGPMPSCYTGAANTQNVGLCRGGTRVCEQGKAALCVNERTPTQEVCDGLDNNCDGHVDEGGICDTKPVPTDSVMFPAGEFTLGASTKLDPLAQAISESPPVKTYLSKYTIDKYEVTNQEYKKCVKAGKCKAPDITVTKETPGFPKDYWNNTKYELFPVVGVTWKEARNFCLWKGKDLPTEAQWERAAKGTNTTFPWYRFSWGETFPKSCDYANILLFEYKKGSGKDHHRSLFACSPHPARVGGYKKDKSPASVFDMVGNVSEWTRDCFGLSWYGLSKNLRDPAYLQCEQGGNIPPDAKRTVRGGSFRTIAEQSRTTHRTGVAGNKAKLNIGFRCAKTAK